MKYRSGIHNHTTFSDGKNTPEEMVLAALEQGFVSCGFSDHSDTPCDHSYCMFKENYGAYRETCRVLREKYASRIDVLCGIEKDRESEIDFEMFDYAIGSVHYLPTGVSGERFPVDESADDQWRFIRDCCGGDKMEFVRRYFDAVASHARSKSFQIQGHFDFIVKYGLFDDSGEAFEKIALDALDAVLENVPYIEVNCGGVTRHGRLYPYPAPALLERIRDRGGKLVLGADAHKTADLDAGFDGAIALLKKLGFTEIYRLRSFGFEPVKL